MSDDQNQEQDGEGGEIGLSLYEKLLGLIEGQDRLIQGLIDTQGNQATINNQTIEIIKLLGARIEMLEQVNGLHGSDS